MKELTHISIEEAEWLCKVIDQWCIRNNEWLAAVRKENGDLKRVWRSMRCELSIVSPGLALVRSLRMLGFRCRHSFSAVREAIGTLLLMRDAIPAKEIQKAYQLKERNDPATTGEIFESISYHSTLEEWPTDE